MEESQADVRGFDVQETNSSVMAEIRTKPTFNPDELYYDMSGEKKLFIFNHYTFESTRYFNDIQPPTRDGTNKDVIRLTQVFKELGFDVKTFHDKTHRQILDEVKAISLADHKETSCLFMAFLSHGDKLGNIYAADRPYQLKDVLTFLEHGHPSLIAKPKVLFIQACRGCQADDGRRIEMDSDSRASYLIPTHADFLILYSTVEDYKSYRDINGSYLMQELCDIIEDYHKFYDLLHLLTLVQKRVAFHRVTFNSTKKNNHNKKQMPETKFTLTKFIKL